MYVYKFDFGEGKLHKCPKLKKYIFNLAKYLEHPIMARYLSQYGTWDGV